MEQKMHGFRARLDYVLKHNVLLNKMFNITASAALRFMSVFVRVDKDMILYCAHGRRYNDSPRAIYEYMIARPEFAHMKMVWALEDVDFAEIPGNAARVKVDTWAYFKASMKAKYWVACTNIERSLHYQKKNQVYLNTWHGVALNTIGNEANGRKDYDFSNINYFCYESEFNKEHIIRAFNVREDALIPTGLPRNDELYHVQGEDIVALKQKLGLPMGKKVILYAPTWRDSEDNGATYAIKPPINIDLWEKELGGEYVLLLRTHAYTNTLLGVEFNEFVRDFTSYPSINDLFKVSDILISDYSSCITDYSILERPIICFAYDYETYKQQRGLNIDFEKEMPSGILGTEKLVLEHIKTMNYERECLLTRDKVKNRFTNIGGNATELCVRALFQQ